MKISAISQISEENNNLRRNLFIQYSNSFMSMPKVENAPIDLTAVNEQIDARLDGMTIDMITEEEYNALSDNDKNNPGKLFIVTNPSEEPVVDVSELVTKQELEKQDYFIFSIKKYEDNKYSEADLTLYMELIKQHFYQDGIINCPYIEDNNIVDNLLLIPKTIINI